MALLEGSASVLISNPAAKFKPLRFIKAEQSNTTIYAFENAIQEAGISLGLVLLCHQLALRLQLVLIFVFDEVRFYGRTTASSL